MLAHSLSCNHNGGVPVSGIFFVCKAAHVVFLGCRNYARYGVLFPYGYRLAANHNLANYKGTV